MSLTGIFKVRVFMSFKVLLSFVIMALCFTGTTAAQDNTLDVLDTKRSKMPPRPILNIGPITTISTAGLLIATFDTNGDYQVDHKEFVAGYKAAFPKADTDSNGRLGLVELEVWRTKAFGDKDATPGSLFFDTDYSQTTTRAEFYDAFERVFELSDEDGNRVIEFTEIAKVVTPRKPQERGRDNLQRLGQHTPNVLRRRGY